MLSSNDKKLLERHRPGMMSSIDLHGSTLLAELRARQALTQQQEEVIKAKAGNFSQVGELLDILLKGDVNTMDKFICALRCSGHGAVVGTYLREPLHDDTPDPSAAGEAKQQEQSHDNRTTLGCKRCSTPCSEEPSSAYGDVRDRPEGAINLRAEISGETHSPSPPRFWDDVQSNMIESMKILLKKIEEGTATPQEAGFLKDLTFLYRDVLSITRGCILFLVKCPSLAALRDLKDSVESNRLRESFIQTFCTPQWMARFDIKSADVKLGIDQMEYVQCEQELAASAGEACSSTTTSAPTTPPLVAGMQNLVGGTLTLSKVREQRTISWKQGSFFGIGGDMNEKYYICDYTFPGKMGEDVVPVFVHEDNGRPAKTLKIDRKLQYGMNNGILFFVLHENFKFKPYQHRFIRTDLQQSLYDANVAPSLALMSIVGDELCDVPDKS